MKTVNSQSCWISWQTKSEDTHNVSDTICGSVIQHSPHFKTMLEPACHMKSCHTSFNLTKKCKRKENTNSLAIEQVYISYRIWETKQYLYVAVL